MAGESLRTRLAVSNGAVYVTDPVNGDVTNGGTGTTVLGTGTLGNTTVAGQLTDTGFTFTSAHVGQGIAVNIAGTWAYRKITSLVSATTVAINGATLTSGTGRTWRLGGPWLVPQDFFDKCSATAASPAPGDICKARKWETTLGAAVADAVSTTVVLAQTGAALKLPTSGTKFALELEPEAEYAFGTDGTTAGTNTLSHAQAVFSAAMVGKQVWIQDQTSNLVGAWQQRTVSSVAGDFKSLVFSGATIAAATNRAWKVLNIELVTVTSWVDGAGQCTCTVTRGMFGSMANAHASGVRVVVPYQGKRATSLIDTGARTVINTPGTALAPYTFMNYDSEDIYFVPNADLTVGSAGQGESFVIRGTGAASGLAQYWWIKRNPLGGLLTIERGRDDGTTNLACLLTAGANDIEIDGVRLRYANRGSGIITDDVSNRVHKYGVRSYCNDIHLSFNHHGYYEQGNSCDTVNCISHDHAFGNGLQLFSTAVSCTLAHNTFLRNRGIPSGGSSSGSQETAGIFCDGANTGTVIRNCIVLDGKNGFRGSAPSTGSGNTCWKCIANGNQTTQFGNQTTGTSLLEWSNSANYSTTGVGADDLTSDPLLTSRYASVDTTQWRPSAGSPAYNYGDSAYRPALDFDGNVRSVVTAGAFRAPEELPTGSAFITLTTTFAEN